MLLGTQLYLRAFQRVRYGRGSSGQGFGRKDRNDEDKVIVFTCCRLQHKETSTSTIVETLLAVAMSNIIISKRTSQAIPSTALPSFILSSHLVPQHRRGVSRSLSHLCLATAVLISPRNWCVRRRTSDLSIWLTKSQGSWKAMVLRLRYLFQSLRFSREVCRRCREISDARSAWSL